MQINYNKDTTKRILIVTLMTEKECAAFCMVKERIYASRHIRKKLWNTVLGDGIFFGESVLLS